MSSVPPCCGPATRGRLPTPGGGSSGGTIRAALIVGLTVLAVLAALAGSARAAGAPPTRLGSRPPIPAGAQDLGPLPQTTSMQATVALAPRDPAGLATYAQAVATPGSGSYHQYLTVGQFVTRFGPSTNQVDAVRTSLHAQGLNPGTLTPNGLALHLTATAAQLAAAFHTSFENYRLPSGQIAYANTSAPSIPNSVAGIVQNVVGLNTLDAPRPLSVTAAAAPGGGSTAAAQVATGGPTPCAQASSNASRYGSYTADRLAGAYGFTNAYAAGNFGAGVTVALFELEPYHTSDVGAYQSCYGTSASVTNVRIDGGSGTGAGSGEAALDIEDVIGLAPKANILVYEGPNSGSGAYDTYNAIISDDRAQVISTSWGICEASQGATAAAAENTLFQEAAVQGQSIFAASGDHGTDDCSTGAGPAVDDPASQPYVTSVGGTTLSSAGPPPTESVWDTSSGAGGGGISSLWAMPSYQSQAPSSLGVINAQSSGSPCGSTGYCREVPDVSADANPNTGYEIYWKGGWLSYGGTSAATPTWAALTTLADASAGCAGTTVGFANAAIYRAAASDYAGAFNDVTVGSNAFGGMAGFPALTGFDMATGLGSPRSPAALCAAADTVTITDPGPQSATQATATSLRLSATSSAGTPITYAASNLPPGLVLDAPSGQITGTPTTTGTWTVSASARDSSGAMAATTFSWSVTAAMPHTATSTTAAPVSTAPVSTTPVSTAPVSTTTVTTTPVSTPPPIIIAPPLTPAPELAVLNPGGQLGRVGVARRLQILATEAGQPALTYSALGLPAGLRINAASGLISGTPARTERGSVTVTVTDGHGGAARTTFIWTIAGRPRVRASSIRLRRGGHIRLSVTILAGARAAGIKSVLVRLPAGVHLALTARDRRLGVSAVSASGAHLPNRPRLVHDALLVKLSRTTRAATVTLFSPQVLLSPRLRASLTGRRARTFRLTATPSDGAGITTRLSATATITTTLR